MAETPEPVEHAPWEMMALPLNCDGNNELPFLRVFRLSSFLRSLSSSLLTLEIGLKLLLQRCGSPKRKDMLSLALVELGGQPRLRVEAGELVVRVVRMLGERLVVALALDFL